MSDDAEHIIEADIARRLVAADADQGRERGHALSTHLPGDGALDFGHQLAQHAEIVAGFEALGGDQRLAPNLVEGVFELVDPIRGVDVDHDEAGLRRRELGDHPLGVVRRPDGDALARRQAERQEPGGERVDPLLELAIGPPHVLLPHDQRRTVGPALCRLIEIGPDRIADEGGA